MKNRVVVVICGVSMLLSGCAGVAADHRAEQQKKYNDLSKCEPIEAIGSASQPTKELLVSKLKSGAIAASGDNFIADTKAKTLQMVGWNDSVFDSIATCRVNNRQARIDAIKPIFDGVKLKTKDKDERRALIEAYSSWEAYLMSLTAAAKQDFESKLSYYKNM